MSATGKREGPVDLEPVIARLRQIAAEAGDHLLLGDGPPNPDAKLLDLCATILDVDAEAKAIDREARINFNHRMPDFRAEMDKRDIVQKRAVVPIGRVSKIEAKTAAGIYAKALVLRHRAGYPSTLALSLANDFINCPGLRSALWPAERV